MNKSDIFSVRSAAEITTLGVQPTQRWTSRVLRLRSTAFETISDPDGAHGETVQMIDSMVGDEGSFITEIDSQYYFDPSRIQMRSGPDCLRPTTGTR